jgi:cytochrome P450
MQPSSSLAALFGSTTNRGPNDPYPVYRRLRDESPVLPVTSWTGGNSYLLTRYDDVREALRNDALFSNRSNERTVGAVFGRTIIEMDGREHLRHRNIITPALAPRALKGGFPAAVASIAHELIDRFAADGRADLVADFTFTFPLRVFTLILDLPVEDYDAFHRWSIDLTGVSDDPPAALEASRLVADYLRPIVEKRRAEEGGDLISRLVHAEVEGERLSDEEVISFLRLLVTAGAETTYHLIGSALYALLTHPEQLEELRADPSLLQSTIDETLRWESPISITNREVLSPTEVGGVAIPAGAGIVLAIGSANRDERKFPEPDRFDIHRSPNEHVAFGFGKHYCAGSRLAYLEARVGLRALLDRLPGLRLDPGQDCGLVGFAFRGPDRLPVLFERG